MNMRKLSRWLYLASRTAGDINAAERGPSALARRVGRREVKKTVSRALPWPLGNRRMPR